MNRTVVLMQLSHAFRETRWTWLQDVGGLDLKNPIRPHRRGLGPAMPIHNRRLLHPLSAPRREDDLRIPSYDFQRVDDAIPGQAGGRKFGEDRRAAGDFD